MFSQLLKPVLSEEVGYPCTVEEVRHSIQKERRIIDTLEPVMNSHKLIIDKKIVEDDYSSRETNLKESLRDSRDLLSADNSLYQLFYQMSRLTFDKGALRHDDRLDALAIAVGYWVEQMSRDEALGVEDERSKALQLELEDFMDAVNNPVVNRKTNRASKPMIWMN